MPTSEPIAFYPTITVPVVLALSEGVPLALVVGGTEGIDVASTATSTTTATTTPIPSMLPGGPDENFADLPDSANVVFAFTFSGKHVVA